MNAFWKKRRKEIFIISTLTIIGCFLFWKYGYHWMKALRYIILMGFLVVLGFIDQKKTIIPNRILLWMVGIRIVLLAGECAVFTEYAGALLKSAGFGMLTGSGIFLLAYLFSRGSIGMGDVKLMGVLGGYLGAALIWLYAFFFVLFILLYRFLERSLE